MNKQEILDGVIAREGGYVDDPDDSGGETKFGITKKQAVAHGYTNSVRHLPRSLAYNIYSEEYWDSVKCDEIIKISPSLAAELIDTSVNCGPARAVVFLQTALNSLNLNEELYSDVSVDGHFGQMTLLSTYGYLERRDDTALVKALNCLQGAFYIGLTEKRQKDEKFIYGWLNHRID